MGLIALAFRPSSSNRRFRNRHRKPEPEQAPTRDLDVGASSLQEEVSTSRFGNRRRGGHNRFRNRLTQSKRKTTTTEVHFLRILISHSFLNTFEFE